MNNCNRRDNRIDNNIGFLIRIISPACLYLGGSVLLRKLLIIIGCMEQASELITSITASVIAAISWAIYLNREPDRSVAKERAENDKTIYPAIAAAVIASACIAITTTFINATLLRCDPAPAAGTGYIVMYCISGPIAEEIIYRGFIEVRESKSTGKSFALIVSTLLFAFAHMNPVLIVLSAPMGLIMGLIREMSGTIVIPIIAHSLTNIMLSLTGSWNASPVAAMLGAIGEICLIIYLCRHIHTA